MGEQRQRTRIKSKIDLLSPEAKEAVDMLLLDPSYTYQDISIWLRQKHEVLISKSSIGRYALRTNKVKERLQEAQFQTDQLVKMIKANPNEDYTDAAMQMFMAGLTEKIAYAQDEWEDMELDKAGRLLVSIARADTYKRKAIHDMKKKAELAFNELEESLMAIVKSNKELAKEMNLVLQKARDQVLNDE